jgi:tetratricopeptide (TPR) repeat protein
MAERDPHTQTFSAPGDAGMAPLHLFSAGMQLGNRYEIRRVIDWGGFAVVYLAHDRMLQREIALKVLRPDRMSDAAMARFRREVAVARDAASPRLVRVFDIETSDGAIYLTMELIDGGSLRKRLSESQLPIDEVIRIAIAIAEGLQALHALGIVHRDVKPGNVLLDSSGEVKLADFGLARHLESDAGHATTTGTIVGTLAYLSPEQALGHPIDHRTDLYSLGVVLFEMLTGSVPFEGESALGTLLARMKASPQDVRQLRRDCPRWLSALVARLLERDPENRYASAAAVLADLRRRRSALAPRRVVRGAAMVFVALIVVAAAFLAWRSWHWRNGFSHVIAGDDGLMAVSRSGKVLWRRSDVAEEPARKYVVLENGHEGRREIAIVLRKPSDFAMATLHTLSFLDPQTGTVTRRVTLPNAADRFPYLPALYMLGSLRAVDLDRDGGDEVLATYIQLPEWPSYTVLYEPRVNRSRVVMQATGHFHPGGAADVDGDGRDEILFHGIHNGWGWYNGACAVRVQPPVNAFDDLAVSAATPDIQQPLHSLAWFTYLPRGRHPDGIRMVREKDRIHVKYPDGRDVALTLNGVDIRLANPAERASARDRALAALRRADELTSAGAFDPALESNAEAARQAAAAGLELLGEAARIRRGRILVASGRLAAADGYYESISRGAEAAPDIALEAAERFHLAGDLERALRWYQRALRHAKAAGVGRSPHEVIKGLTLAAAEAKRFAEGLIEVERFLAGQPPDANDMNSYYREFLRWRSGLVPEVHARPSLTSIDLTRYWALEFAWARGARPEELLPQLPAELEERSPARSGLLSLRAELLDRAGRRDEARRTIETALSFSEIDSARDVIARGHRDLVRERHGRITKSFSSSRKGVPATPATPSS